MLTHVAETEERPDESAGPTGESAGKGERGRGGASRVCPRCGGLLKPTPDRPRGKPDYWVRIDAEGRWAVSRTAPGLEESATLVLYNCETCQVLVQLIGPKLRR